MIDPENEYLLTKYRWRLINGYLATNDFHGGLVYLHRFLLGAKKGEKVEHINGDKLDNRLSNLRINNKIRWKNIPDTEKGIQKNRYKYRWINGKNVYLGKISKDSF